MLVPALLLWLPVLGRGWRLVIADPVLSEEIGVNVCLYGRLSYLIGAGLSGVGAVLDGLDASVGAGPRAAFPALVAASFAVLSAEAIAGRGSYLTVAVLSLSLAIGSTVFGFLLADGERLLPPLLLVAWLLAKPPRAKL